METLLWIVYWAGVVLFPILVGMWFGKDLANKNASDMYNFFDSYIPLVFLSFLWPFVLGLVILFGIAVLICTVLGAIGMCLSLVGFMIGQKLGIDKNKEKNKEESK